PDPARLPFACGCAGDPDSRVPGPGVRGVSRLRARFAASVETGEHLGRHGPRAARALAVSALAPRSRRAPRHLRRPGPPRRRGCADVDRRRVSGSFGAGSACLPAVSSSPGDVRPRAGVRDAHRTAVRGARRTTADTQKVLRTDVALVVIVAALCWL